MKRIQTEAEMNKKKKKNQILVGVVMISLLVVSTLGYSLMSSDKDDDSEVNEFGIDFFKENGFWKIFLDGSTFGFQNLPSEVLDIEVNISSSLEMYSEQPLYFVNPNEGSSEVLNNIGQYILRYQKACVLSEGENSCEGDLPVKNCESNLIIFKEGIETKVYQDGNCVYIIGDGIKGADAFLYELLDVI